MITRLYVEKKENFNTESKKLLKDIKENIHVDLEGIRIINTYDIENLDDKVKNKVVTTVLSEPNVDIVSEEIYFDLEKAFRIKLLSGQFDQRANSAVECSQIVALKKLNIESSKIYVLEGNVTKEDIIKVKKYLINPVENEEVNIEKPQEFNYFNNVILDVEVINGFTNFTENEMVKFLNANGFAMDIFDIMHIQKYFINELRNPTITELKVLDTYWSDHCRHTTFTTKLEDIEFENNDYIEETFNRYNEIRKEINRDKDITLMDLAVVMMKYEKEMGNLDNLDISDEVNACTINVKVDVNNEDEDYLIMFKNETHNHPTEIEPFGGASTCLGGAIRDPLSGRSYVYQGMRVTGSGDPRVKVENTLKGKLPQRIITKKAAQGFSSYGNQIGLATGLVDEIYNEGFIAKRMEVGAVVGATPKKDVNRMKPLKGDLILLLGGKTGRDGCGGATGSSKKHSEKSILLSGAEVQKGNAPEERKLQRLYRISEFSKAIKKSNDFGAGGVSVAIGELADSLTVNLDKVPKKYEGLNGTELAISESQERMAIVIDKKDLKMVEKYCHMENIEATVVAEVTDTGRFIMKWKDQEIFNIKRSFIETNGVSKYAKVKVNSPKGNYFESKKIIDFKNKFRNTMSDLNVCSKKGLSEMFDSTVGAGTVLMPFGGKYMNTPIQSMVAKVPVLNGETNTCTIMSYGYDSEIGKWSPYHAGVYNVISSIAKIVSSGGKYEDIRFSFQEYFESLSNNPEKWGKPFAALLGTIKVQDEFNLAAIGGKDSMSGTFNEINVPPTLISFALAQADYRNIISPEFKNENNFVYQLKIDMDDNYIPDFIKLKKGYSIITEMIKENKILSAYALGLGGLSESISKMAFGNRIGFEFDGKISNEEIFNLQYGSIVFETENEITDKLFDFIGKTTKKYEIKKENEIIDLNEIENIWEKQLDEIFPRYEEETGKITDFKYEEESRNYSKEIVEKPKVFIPAFPGTNCEYDTKKAFERVGGIGKIVVFKNQNNEDIENSINEMVNAINESQIIAIPGGFSAGDEPEGSGKFIASVFRNEKIKNAIENLLNERDGLIIGICNGFQALIKLGLLPYGEIRSLDENSPTLTFNKLGRHVSNISKIKMVSNKSPWLKEANFDDFYDTPMSHGEGRFYANEEVVNELIEKGQIVTRYVDFDGNPTFNGKFNPNGSIEAVEGIVSENGRVFGKMGHVERINNNVLVNIYDKKDMKIFESGIKYFTHK
ncbi:phosphoribosylformylglycinamidine synthase [Clostridiaceae bacterium HSG29]|nr:phosphoribosylformylglycinamidine synthase [Clostridiaceae bacterium HSG29]